MNESALRSISIRAVANAESFLRFEKDAPAVNRDALHDQKEIDGLFCFHRLREATRMLLRATQTITAHKEYGPGAKLALSGLIEWVREEQGTLPGAIP